MPCTKAQLVSAINSYAAARVSADGPLIQMAAQVLGEMVDTLTYAEPEPTPEIEESDAEG